MHSPIFADTLLAFLLLATMIQPSEAHQSVCSLRGNYQGHSKNTTSVSNEKKITSLILREKSISFDMGYPNGRGISIESETTWCKNGKRYFTFSDDGWGEAGKGVIFSHNGHVDVSITNIHVAQDFPPGLPSEIVTMYDPSVFHLRRVK